MPRCIRQYYNNAMHYNQEKTTKRYFYIYRMLSRTLPQKKRTFQIFTIESYCGIIHISIANIRNSIILWDNPYLKSYFEKSQIKS